MPRFKHIGLTFTLVVTAACTGGSSPLGGNELALCVDLARDGRETDIDCGGPICDACLNGNGCGDGSDCASGFCDRGQCVAVACTNNVMDPGEVDVDCGGLDCALCVAGDTCTGAGDCSSGGCLLDICQAATCTDGIANGAEGGIDCGESCPSACIDGSACLLGTDCASRVCGSDGDCAVATCGDQTWNGDETGADCGGICANVCADGSGCLVGGDCASGVCTAQVCVPNTCNNDFQDPTEADIDCGGDLCAPCAVFSDCITDGDCAVGICNAGTCAESGFEVLVASPNGDVSLLLGATLDLEARFWSAGLRVSPDSAIWTSSLDGELGRGDLVPNVALGPGVHVITLTAELGGRTSAREFAVTVSSIAVRITRPNAGDVAPVGGMVRFTGGATVDLGAPVTLVSGGPGPGSRAASFTWRSSLDGDLGTMRDFITNTLSAGQHTIALTVADDSPAVGTGLVGQATVFITIQPLNDAPVVGLTAPAACPQQIEIGAVLDLTATATDTEDGALVGHWLDSMDGSASAGNSLAFGAAATPGKHTFTFVARDSLGVGASVSCDVFVTAVGVATLFPDTSALNTAVNNVGLPADLTWIGFDPDGNTWVGTAGGLAVIISGSGTRYDADEFFGGGGNTEILDVAFLGARAFIGTTDGLAVCDYAAGVLSSCARVVNSGGFDYEGLAISGTGDDFVLAAAADRGGLLLTVYETGMSPVGVRFRAADSNLPNDNVADAVFVGTTLYVGGNAGLCVVENPAINVASPTTTLCSSTLSTALDRVGDADIRSLAYDGTFLWLGTDNGLVRYAPATDALVVYDEAAGLGNDRVNGIAIDANGILWLGTNGGASRVNPEAMSITNLTGQDLGIGGNDNILSVFIDSVGVKWFATEQDGVVQYSGQ